MWSSTVELSFWNAWHPKTKERGESMCNYNIDPEDWEKGWDMDADEAEDLLAQYDDLQTILLGS